MIIAARDSCYTCCHWSIRLSPILLQVSEMIIASRNYVMSIRRQVSSRSLFFCVATTAQSPAFIMGFSHISLCFIFILRLFLSLRFYIFNKKKICFYLLHIYPFYFVIITKNILINNWWEIFSKKQFPRLNKYLRILIKIFFLKKNYYDIKYFNIFFP